MKNPEKPSLDDSDKVLAEPSEHSLFRLQLAYQSVDEKIKAGDETPILKDIRDMITDQITLLERIIAEPDEDAQEELKNDFFDSVKRTESLRRQLRASQSVH